MRWKQLINDTPRALALADILCYAALADDEFHETERVVIGAMMMKVLGVAELPPELEQHIARAEGRQERLAAACDRLGLYTGGEKRALLKAVAAVVMADEELRVSERRFVMRLARVLKVPLEKVDELLS